MKKKVFRYHRCGATASYVRGRSQACQRKTASASMTAQSEGLAWARSLGPLSQMMF